MPSSKHQWLISGLELLAGGGVKLLTIDRLSAEMGLTKGSFYYHFTGGRDYERQLVRFWVQQQLSALPVLPKNPTQRLARLDNFVEDTFVQGGETEPAMRSWAQQDDMVRSELEQVDSARCKFLLSALESVVVDRSRINLMADMLLAILTSGLIDAHPKNQRRIRALYVEYKRLYGLDRMDGIDLQTRLPI
jgi:AcrR family transcriptional regulator